MKKLIVGMIIGAAITSGIFYYIGQQNENETRENLKTLLASMKDSKTTQQQLDEVLNDPKSTMIFSTATTVISAPNDEFYYYKGNDCDNLMKGSLENIKEVLGNEKKMAPPSDLMIIIKKIPGAALRNSMDLLDAITSAGIPAGHFAEISLSAIEKNCIQNYKKQ